MKDENCIFCKIIAGEIPANKVYEDDDVFAFLDIEPIREGHTLVIPKEHHEYIEDMPDELYSKMMLVVKKLKALYKNLFNVKQVGFFVSGWDVPHTHVHVVPMHEPKDITSKSSVENTKPQFTQDEFDATTKKITQAL